MNPIRIKAIIKKEFVQIRRDARSLALAIALPMLLLVLFGFALSLDVDKVPMVVWDQSQTPLSRAYLLNFQNSRYFKITGYAGSYTQIENNIDRDISMMALVIPYDFSRQLEAGKPSPVQLLVNGSDSNTAAIALGYVSAVTQSYNRKMVETELAKSGRKLLLPVDLRPRVWFNPELKSRNYIIPGLIAVIMMIIAALLTSQTIAREWERGTMEQLISTPVSVPELILGKLVPYFVIALLDISIAVAMGEFVFAVPLRGSILLLFTISSIFLIGVLGLGILISVVTKTQLLASQLALLATFLPTFILSGFIYPIANMPVAIQLITYLIPARYFISILKSLYLKGGGIRFFWLDIIYLLLFMIIMIGLATRKFTKRIA